MMARAVGTMSRGAAGNTTSNATPSGIQQGTIGGKARAAGASRPGMRNLNVGDELYLWFLIALEVGAMGWLRHHFRRRHGG
jgi:hypothetical protein